MKANLCKNCFCYIIIAISLFLFPFITNVYSQSSGFYQSNGRQINLGNNEYIIHSELTENGKIVSEYSEDPNEIVRLIVIFREEPLAFYQQKATSLKKVSLTSAYAALQASHASFKTALEWIKQKLSAQLSSDYSYVIKREYYRSLNGIALECKRGMIAKIRSLPMVKHVSIDREVTIDLMHSVHQIRADIVQDSLGFTGEGVLVGDIDTGIDYNNPALGGGFGSSYRVIGGHDFANNDNDPKDDHGHGTHVAGIIGANGDSLRGVAPGVKFLAVKVLNFEGRGYFSDVIAGIDYCLDPDNNPETDDAVHIINMSLGALASSDNPVDSAVNNATKAGVLSVVAAGNHGNGNEFFLWGRVSSPGTSESALTVGACDSSYIIANFSSSGPDPIHSSIKPEVVAPGVGILSMILNNQTASWSGTSMAAPHVCGVAALLKQEHPSWNPGEIKSAIVNTAHSIGESVSIFVQGKGCVDALDAAEAKLLVEPGVISFGVVDLALDEWADTVEIIIRNYHSTTQNIHVSVVDGLPAGASITFDKESFSLAAGGEATVTAILTVPSSVPVLKTEPFAYTGNIEVISESDSIIVPYSFSKSSTLIISFDEQASSIWLVNRNRGEVKSIYLAEGERKLTIPISEAKLLDIITFMLKDSLEGFNYYLVKRSIEDPVGLTYIFMSSNEATINVMNDNIYDIDDNIITLNPNSEAIFKLGLNVKYNNVDNYYFRTHYFPIGICRMFSTPFDSSYYIDKSIIGVNDPEYYILRKAVYGFDDQQDIAFSSGKDNLYRYSIASLYDDPYLQNTIGFEKHIGFNVIEIFKFQERITILGSSSRSFPATNKKLSIYFNSPNLPIKNGVYYNKHMNIFAISDRKDYIFEPSLITPTFMINENGDLVFEELREPNTSSGSQDSSVSFVYEVMNPGDTIKIEQYTHVNFPYYLAYSKFGSLFMEYKKDWVLDAIPGMFTSSGIKQYNGLCEKIYTWQGSFWEKPRFTVQTFADNIPQTDTEPLYKESESVYYKYDNLRNNILHVLANGHPYTILGQAGQSTIDCEFRMPESGITNFPSFNLIQVRADGKVVEKLHPDENGTIRLILFNNDKIIESVKISLLLPSGDEISLPVTNIGENEYNAPIPNYIPEGFIDILVRAEDAKGNKSELTLSPGFYFGSSADSASFDARICMSTYSLDNVEAVEFAKGDTLNYTLSFVNFGNVTAKDVEVQLPVTPYFSPVGSQSIIIDSIAITDTVKIPFSLIFQGKQQTSDEQAYYLPAVSWTSNGTDYVRNAKVLVDFQNTVTGVTQMNSTIPIQYELYQNYPNPFNPSTTIKYDLPKESRVSLVVYNILGQQVEILVDDMKPAGRYEVSWNGSMSKNLASGVYLLSIRAGNFNKTIKMLLLK